MARKVLFPRLTRPLLPPYVQKTAAFAGSAQVPPEPPEWRPEFYLCLLAPRPPVFTKTIIQTGWMERGAVLPPPDPEPAPFIFVFSRPSLIIAVSFDPATIVALDNGSFFTTPNPFGMLGY